MRRFILGLTIFCVLGFQSFEISAASNPEVEETEYLARIYQLGKRLDRLESVEIPIKTRDLVGHLLGGYAASLTLGWWLGVSGGGPWFFFATTGGLIGMASTVVGDSSARWILKKIQILKAASRLLDNSYLSNRHVDELLELNSRLQSVFLGLLESGRLATSLERWFYLQYVGALIHWLERLGYQNEKLPVETLNQSLQISAQILQQAIEQFDQPIAAKARRAKETLTGIIGYYYTKRNWNDFQEWLNKNRLVEENVIQDIYRLSARYLPDRFDKILILNREIRSAASFLFRIGVGVDENIIVEISPHGLKLFEQKGIQMDQKLTWGELILLLSEGVWIQFEGIGQKTWEFYLDSSELPYSPRQDLGDVLVSKDPFSPWMPTVRARIFKGMTAGLLKQSLGSSLDSRSGGGWMGSRFFYFGSLCRRGLGKFRIPILGRAR